MQNVWSAQSNPAGLAGLKNAGIALGYEKNSFNRDISNKSAVANIPIGKFNIGANFNSFGIQEFNQSKAGFSVAKAFGSELKLGVGVDYYQLNITNYGKDQFFTVNAGVQYQFTKDLNFGLFISNPFGLSFNNYTQTLTAFSVEGGVVYSLSDKLTLNTAVSKAQFQKVAFLSGIQYQPLKILAIRGGISLNPLQQHAGFGLFVKNIMLDFTVNTHPVLGYTPQIAVSYAF